MNERELNNYRLYLITYFQATKAAHPDKVLGFLEFTPRRLTIEDASEALSTSLGLYHGLYGRPPLNFPQFKVRCSEVNTSMTEGFETSFLD